MNVAVILDSSQSVRKVVAHILAELGYLAIECQDTTDVIERIRQDVPDLVVVDRHMANIDALALMTQIRAAPECSRTVVLCGLTENDPAEIETVCQAGANGFVLKPYDELNFREVLADARKRIAA